MMKQRRRMLARPFTAINYLGADGSQYFSTGVIPNKNTGVEIKFRQTVANTYPFGLREGDYRYYSPRIHLPSQNFGNRWTYGVGKQIINTSYSGVLGNDYTTNFNLNGSGNVYINDTLIETISPENIIMTNEALLFGILNNGEIQAGTLFCGRIYYCKVYDGEVLIRDFIPVLDNCGTPCMFDKVEGKFYYNEGTGVFSHG